MTGVVFSVKNVNGQRLCCSFIHGVIQLEVFHLSLIRTFKSMTGKVHSKEFERITKYIQQTCKNKMFQTLNIIGNDKRFQNIIWVDIIYKRSTFYITCDKKKIHNNL